MEKLKNIELVIDGMVTQGPPVIADKVITIVSRPEYEAETGILGFIVREAGERVLVEVHKDNLVPSKLSKAKDLEVGMYVLILGQVAEYRYNNIIHGDMSVIIAETVHFMLMEELDPTIRETLEKDEKERALMRAKTISYRCINGVKSTNRLFEGQKILESNNIKIGDTGMYILGETREVQILESEVDKAVSILKDNGFEIVKIEDDIDMVE